MRYLFVFSFYFMLIFSYSAQASTPGGDDVGDAVGGCRRFVSTERSDADGGGSSRAQSKRRRRDDSTYYFVPGSGGVAAPPATQGLQYPMIEHLTPIALRDDEEEAPVGLFKFMRMKEWPIIEQLIFSNKKVMSQVQKYCAPFKYLIVQNDSPFMDIIKTALEIDASKPLNVQPLSQFMLPREGSRFEKAKVQTTYSGFTLLTNPLYMLRWEEIAPAEEAGGGGGGGSSDVAVPAEADLDGVAEEAASTDILDAVKSAIRDHYGEADKDGKCVNFRDALMRFSSNRSKGSGTSHKALPRKGMGPSSLIATKEELQRLTRGKKKFLQYFFREYPCATLVVDMEIDDVDARIQVPSNVPRFVKNVKITARVKGKVLIAEFRRSKFKKSYRR